jgi:hypothetical protein
MSAFSDWNGPGGGGDGYYIRYIRDIENKIIELNTALTNTTKDLKDHESDDSAAHKIQNQLNLLRTTLAVYAESLQYTFRGSADQTAIDNAIGTAKSGAISEAKTYTDGETANLWPLYKGYIDTEIGIEAQARADRDNALTNLIAGIQKVVDVTGETIRANTITPINNGTIIDIKATLNALDIYCQDLYLDNKMDFVNFRLVEAIAYANPGKGSSNYVLIVGKLSNKFDPDIFQTTTVKPKPATAFIKFVDGMPWNAIVEMSASISNNNLDHGRGAITAVVSKAPRTENLAIVERGPITFGLYKSTTVGGEHNIYLGIQVEEINGIPSGGHAASIQFYMAGINFIPDTTGIPSGAIEEICTAVAVKPGDFAVSHISTEGLNTDAVNDTTDQNIISVDENGNLRIGSNEDFKQVTIYSTDRPTVVHADLSANKIAYLSDLSQSVYWQRSVSVVANTLTTLNQQVVTTDGNGKVIKWDATSANNVPGYYLTDPISNEPAGHIFTTSGADNKPDTALIKVSGTKERVVDGEVHDTIVVGKAYPINQITGVAPEVVIQGTTVVDNIGNKFKVATLVPTTGIVTFEAITTDTDIFSYDCPAYAVFDGTTFNITDIIAVPKTFDGYIHDVSYEWSGVHELPITREGNKPYFVESYVTWTPHHQNSTTVAYSGEAWDYVDLYFEGFRSAARQDEIDLSLEALAFTQSDFSDNSATTTFALPEQDTKTIPNPAYIQHKPWTGVAVIDGGTFSQPNVYNGWVVDGGDFTGMNGAMLPPESTPAVDGSQYFRNAIIRTWHGLYADMPEIISPNIPAIWSNYAFTFRICTDAGANGGLWYSDGTSLIQIKSGALVEDYTAPIVKSEFFHEHDGGGYRLTTASHIIFGGANDGTADSSGMFYEIYAVSNDASKTGMRLKFTDSWAYLTSGTATTLEDKDKLVVKGDLPTKYGIETVVDFSDATYGKLKVLFDVDNNLLHFSSNYLLDASSPYTDLFPWANILPRDPGRMHIPNAGYVEGIIYADRGDDGKIPMVVSLTFKDNLNGQIVLQKCADATDKSLNEARFKGDFTCYIKSVW